MKVDALREEHVAQLRAALIGPDQTFAPSWLNPGARTVVPFETPLAIDDDFASRICEAFRGTGSDVAWGFSAESWAGMLPYEGIVVDLTPTAVQDWHTMFLPFDMALASPNGAGAALFTQDEFGLAAGSPAFLEAFVGTTIAAACQAFTEYAEDMGSAAQHLRTVAAHYCG